MKNLIRLIDWLYRKAEQLENKVVDNFRSDVEKLETTVNVIENLRGFNNMESSLSEAKKHLASLKKSVE